MKGHDNKGHSYNALPQHNGSEVRSVLLSCFDLSTTKQQLFVSHKKRLKCLLYILVIEGKKSGSRLMSLQWGGGRSQKSHQTFCSLVSSSTLPHFHQVWWKKVPLNPEVSEWLSKGQPDALRECHLPIYACKVANMYLSLGYKFMLFHTTCHWRAEQRLEKNCWF